MVFAVPTLVNVGKYTIHGCYGVASSSFLFLLGDVKHVEKLGPNPIKPLLFFIDSAIIHHSVQVH